MFLEIPAVLDPSTLAAFQELSQHADSFEDGQATAGWHARGRKHNRQATSGRGNRGLLKKAEQVVMAHPVVQSAARPKGVIRSLLSRYDHGMYYGQHVDDAIMDGRRSDLSFTLFISPPEDYWGGALVVDEPSGERVIKPDAGSLFLYPSTALHRVEEVSGGTRVAVVGWIESQVRSAERREILFDLDRVIRGWRDHSADDEELGLLLKTRGNLLRMWVES